MIMADPPPANPPHRILTGRKEVDPVEGETARSHCGVLGKQPKDGTAGAGLARSRYSPTIPSFSRPTVKSIARTTALTVAR